MGKSEYAILIEALSDEDGGEFLASVPDLPGCMSDGETRAEAARNVEDAIDSWMEEAIETGRDPGANADIDLCNLIGRRGDAAGKVQPAEGFSRPFPPNPSASTIPRCGSN